MIENNGPNNSVFSELQSFSRTVINAYSQSPDSSTNDIIRSQFEDEINRCLQTKGNEWPPSSKDLYKKRAEAILYIAHKDSEILRTYTQLKNRGSMANGQRVASGVTIYGGPDWDFTTFLDIKPSQRPADLISYWTERGYNIQEQEAKLQRRNIKTGTLNLSDAYSGAYTGKLRPGFSCASTRFPGGTQLQLRNPDGSIFDPAGINPSGIVTVDDTGNAELTYKKVDLFISREHVASYKATNLNAVEIILVSLGTKQGAQYARAQKKFGSGNIA